MKKRKKKTLSKSKHKSFRQRKINLSDEDKIRGCKFVIDSILGFEEKDYPKIFKSGVIKVKKSPNNKLIYELIAKFEFEHEEYQIHSE